MKSLQLPKRIYPKYRANTELILYPGDVNGFLASLPDSTVDLIITSPPYNLGKEYERRVPLVQYLSDQAQVISQLYRVLKEDGSICWQVGNYVARGGELYPLDILYYSIFKNLGMQLRNRIIWRFGHGFHSSHKFSGRYETILWFTKSDKYTFNLDPIRVPSKYPGKRYHKGPKKGQPSGNPRGKNPSDIWDVLAKDWDEQVWDIPNVKAYHPEKTIIPCQFPIELVERCVLALTNEGDLVFDPYAGVGTSLVAALMHNRRAMGSEKEPKYVKVARKRIQSYFAGTLPYRPLGKPVHQPTGLEKVAKIPEEWKRSRKSR
jgi:adenine-specific DNA-methyltransferase